MSKSLRRPHQLYTIAMWVLSLLFAAMLIGLGGLIIADLPKVDSRISLSQFEDAQTRKALNTRRETLGAEQVYAHRAVKVSRDAYRAARANHETAKESLEAWLATRTATQENAQNPEVLKRTRFVEDLLAEKRAALAALEAAEKRLDDVTAQERANKQARADLRAKARPAYESALRNAQLRAFGYRLALTLPLLLAAGYFVSRKRGSAYWPLYRGFVIFALFAFFIELVPYLPSYGGYVRYLVGVLLLLAVGHYLIKNMRAYLVRKQAEEERSEGERRSNINYETALKKINAGTCPGCDRAIESRNGEMADFCVHCGIHLQCVCPSCNSRNISFHNYCLQCGSPLKTADTVDNSPPDDIIMHAAQP